MKHSGPKRVKLRVALVGFLLIYLVIEGICYTGLVLLKKTRDIVYDPRVSKLSEEQRSQIINYLEHDGKGITVDHDPIVGWIPLKWTNSARMRDNREYQRLPNNGIVRIAAFGDSFTWGADVELEESWGKLLPEMDPTIELLNYGAGAYGFDQAYLRYKKVNNEYNPHIVILGYMSENLARNVNVFRVFYTRSYRNVIFTKPRFILKDNELVLIDNPLAAVEDHRNFLENDTKVLQQLGEHDYHYQIGYDEGPFDFLPTVRLFKVGIWLLKKKGPTGIIRNQMYNTDSNAYQITVRLFDRFYQEVLKDGALPVIIVFPDINDQTDSREGQERRYLPMLEYFDKAGYYYIDTLEALIPHESKYTLDKMVETFGHFSPVANQFVAEYIHKHLVGRGFTNLEKVRTAILAERQRLDIP